MAKPVDALVGTDAFMQTQRLGEIMALLPGDALRIDIDGERVFHKLPDLRPQHRHERQGKSE